MNDNIRSMDLRERNASRRALVASTAVYVLCAIAAVVVSLVIETEFRLPDASWSTLSHGVFFGAFMFPAVSVLALITGWGLYASSNYIGALIAALFPWLWGFSVVLLAFGLR